MVKELMPVNPRVLFSTLVETEEGEMYAIATTFLKPAHQYLQRQAEMMNDVAPQGHPDGLFQTVVYSAELSEDDKIRIDPDKVVGMYRSVFGREAVMNHDRLVDEVDQGIFDQTQDPYYEYLQVKKLKQELENLDIGKLEEEMKGD